MSDVPEELLAVVLSRLSVESLLRFRCVSKRWCSLIDSPNFIKLHLNQSIITNSNLSLIVSNRGLYSVDLDFLDTVADAKKYKYSLKSREIGPDILGSCNGLLCLSEKEENIVFWNLKTRKFWKLPVSPIEVSRGSGFHRVINYSFGYDCVHDDYKLMRMIYFHGANDELGASEVEVYSLKSNSWRKGQDFPFPYYLRYKGYPGVLVNGVVHWPVRQEPESDISHLIVSFDVATEEYGLVPLPECLDKNLRMGLELAVLGGCLCVQCNYYRHRHRDIDDKCGCGYYPVHVDIWVMKDYRVKESWTKLISLAQHSELRSFVEVTPMAYSKNGRRVLMQQDEDEFFWYDLENKTIQSVTIHGMPNYMYADVCLGSLVQPNGGGGGSNGKEQQT